MDLDPLLLSRIQFAFTISFHIIFPAFTIGLAAWLATIEGMQLVTGKPVYRRVFDFWLRVFAVSFGMGVVSGIVMAFQFGTNWSVLSEKMGAIQGPLLGYETFTAFLLEATFLGVVLSGRDRVPRWFYFLACCMISLGTLASSFWIMASNSWMQVPVGHQIINGKIIPSDWPAIMAGPVFLVRWMHMLLAAFLTTTMCVTATGAWYVLRDMHREEARVMMHWGLALAAPLIMVQLFFGHLNGKYVYEHQPSKFAAIEARWESQQPGTEVWFAIPDEARRRNLFAIETPKVGSFIATGTWDARVPGLADFPPRELAACGDPVLRIPGDGRHGSRDVGDQLVGQLAALAWPPGDDALVSVVRLSRLAQRLRRRAHGLVYCRGRAPTLGRLGPAAHSRCDDAHTDRGASACDAHRLRGRLRVHLRVRRSLHLPTLARRSH